VAKAAFDKKSFNRPVQPVSASRATQNRESGNSAWRVGQLGNVSRATHDNRSGNPVKAACPGLKSKSLFDILEHDGKQSLQGGKTWKSPAKQPAAAKNNTLPHCILGF